MKTTKIGDLNFKKYKTEILATNEVIKRLEKDKIPLTNLIPAAWFWYDGELFPELDENGDGKPDDKFGKDFKLVYFLNQTSEVEREALLLSSTLIKNIKIKYAGMKNASNK